MQTSWRRRSSSLNKMENQDKTFRSICRVCLDYDKLDNMVPLISTNQETGLSIYGSALEDITKIQVKENEYFPTNLCKKCKEALEGVSKFIVSCKTSDIKLKKLLKFCLNQELDGDMVKEVIRQYTLFSPNDAEDSINSLNLTHTSNFLNKNNENLIGSEYSTLKVKNEEPTTSKYYNIYDSNEEICKKEMDSVDIFIYSIKKLITTECANKNTYAKTQVKMLTKPKTQTKLEQDFTCNVCHKVLATEYIYKTHIQRHGVCKYVCDQCGKGFPINAELVQHQIHVHGAHSRYECDICSYRAVKKIQLIEHIRLHTGERPFTCEKCGLTFRRKTLFKKHAKFHGEKMVTCDLCPQKFYVRSAMLAHRNKHTRQYNFSCKICNVSYALAKTVKKHMQDIHGIPRHLQGRVQKIYKNVKIADPNIIERRKSGSEYDTYLQV